MTQKERKAVMDAVRVNGRDDFPSSLAWPISTDYDAIDVYYVYYRKNGKVTCNRYHRLQDAKSSVERRKAEGTFSGTLYTKAVYLF